MNICPVCGYRGLRHPPRNFSTCPSCGTEFESDDFGVTRDEVERRRAELRNRWVEGGPRWHSRVTPEPVNWNPIVQLFLAGFTFQLPGGSMVLPMRGPGIHVIIECPERVDMTERRGTAVLVNA